MASFWNNISKPESKGDVNSEAEHIIDEALRRRFETEELTDLDRAELLHAVLFTDSHTISSTALAIKNELLMKMDSQAMQKNNRSGTSYLFQKDFNSLRDFSFNQLLMELSVSNSFLLDCCLSIAVPTAQIFSDNKSKEDLIVRLGMVYSILMSYRFGELSRLQRVMSAILMDKHVHEKVNVNVFHLSFCLYPTKLFVCFIYFSILTLACSRTSYEKQTLC